MKKKTLLGVLIAITFLSGIFVGGCGDGIATVNAENSEQTKQYQHAEMELINSSLDEIREYRDSVTGVHYFLSINAGMTVRYNADGTVFVD
jgi:hypothetical protein